MDPTQRAHQFLTQARQLLNQSQAEGYRQTHKLKLAVQYFEAALEQKTDLLEAHLGLAYIAALCDRQDTAFREIQAAEALDPDNTKVLQLKQEIQGLAFGNEAQPKLSSPFLALNQIQFFSQRAPQMPRIEASLKDPLEFLKREG